MTSKLELYREALLILGEERIASLAEECTARFAIDDHYDRAVAYCLEQGFWNFAMRTVLIDASASVSPQIGYSNAFRKPDDWVRTHTFSLTGSFVHPLLDLVDEAGYWYCNGDPLYVRYISRDPDYGMDLSRWPESYANYVAHRLAVRSCRRITGSEASDEILRAEKRALADSRSKDAMNEPVRFPPQGSWVTSRLGGRSGLDRWNGRSS